MKTHLSRRAIPRPCMVRRYRSKPVATTFDKLRLEVHNKSVLGLDDLPPTCIVIRGHLKREYYVIRNALTLLGDYPAVDLTHYDSFKQDSALLSNKSLKPLPSRILTLCKCSGKCTSERCSCKAANFPCVMYGHEEVLNHPVPTGISNATIPSMSLISNS